MLLSVCLVCIENLKSLIVPGGRIQIFHEFNVNFRGISRLYYSWIQEPSSDALWSLVTFLQFKKRESHIWKVVTFVKLWAEAFFLSVFHIFKILQMVFNREKHFIFYNDHRIHD